MHKCFLFVCVCDFEVLEVQLETDDFVNVNILKQNERSETDTWMHANETETAEMKRYESDILIEALYSIQPRSRALWLDRMV